MTQVAISHSG